MEYRLSTILSGVPFDDYLAHPGYGSGDLRMYREAPVGSPAVVQYWREHRDEASTDSTIFGAAAHCAILTPDVFLRTYRVRPAGMLFTTKEGKAWRDATVAAGIPLQNILKQEESDRIDAIARAVNAMVGGVPLHRAEMTVFWQDPSGLLRKCRPDWYDEDAVYDLKVSIHARKPLGAIRRAIYSCGWMHQLASHRAGIRAAGATAKVGRLVLVDPEAPHQETLRLLEVSEHDLDVLEMDNEQAAGEMQQFASKKHWPGPEPMTWINVGLPEFLEEEDVDMDGVPPAGEEVADG